MKLYVVEGSSGSWDSYVTFIIGIFDSPEKADEGKRKWLAIREEYYSRYTQEEIEKYIDLTDEPEERWSKETHEYVKWDSGVHGDRASEKVKITELSINEIVDKFE